MVTGFMLKVLEGLHNRASRSIEGMMAWIAENREWEYLPVADVLEAAGLWPIK